MLAPVQTLVRVDETRVSTTASRGVAMKDGASTETRGRNRGSTTSIRPTSVGSGDEHYTAIDQHINSTSNRNLPRGPRALL